MPVYNAARFLAPAIESILTQTYKNLELIIVNDASTDNSWRIIHQYGKKYPQKITAVNLKNNRDKGGDPAGNIAFSRAHGKYIARMDADDVSLPERIEKQVKFLETHPRFVAVGSSAHVINKQGDILGQKLVPTKHKDIYEQFFIFHPMIHPTVMIKRSAIKTKDLYQIEYGANNDYLTFFKLISSGKRFANLSEKLLFYRIHGMNDSLIKVKSRFLNSLKIRYRAISEFGYKPTIKSVLKLLAQFTIVLTLPEAIIVPVYLLVRGIAKPSDLVPSYDFLGRVKRALNL